MLSVRCPVLSCPVLSVCDVRALWLNGWTNQDETWHANGFMDEDATWYTEVDLCAGHIALDGFPAFRKRGTAPPPFRTMSIVATVAHLSYC